MQHNVLILDFGSQYTQLIARRVRELNIFCEIFPFDKIPADLSSYKAVILGGSPCSVRSEEALHPDLSQIRGKITSFSSLLRSTIFSPFFRWRSSGFQHKRIRKSEFVLHQRKRSVFRRCF